MYRVRKRDLSREIMFGTAFRYGFIKISLNELSSGRDTSGPYENRQLKIDRLIGGGVSTA